MVHLNYAWEKFSRAVMALVSSAPMQERLHHAYMSFHPIFPEDFADEELRDEYADIMRRLTAIRTDEVKGYVPATLEQMSAEDAQAIADDLVAFCFSIADARLDDARSAAPTRG